MRESSRTKAELIAGIADLKQKIKKLEKSEAKGKEAESQREAALAALKESEIKYRTLIDMTGTGYLILDSQGRVLDANQEYVRLSGHTKLHDILGKSVVAWTAEGAKQRNAEAVAKCANNGFIRDFVTEYVDGGGKITPIEINASVDGEGESLRIVSLCRDITERKQAESLREAALEAVRNSERKYRGLTENINLGIYRNTVGPEGKFIEANPAIIGMFGYKNKEEFLATNVSDLYQNPQDRKKFNDKMLKAGVVKGEELWLKKKDGSFFVGSISAVAVKDEQGQVTYYDGIIDNIEDRKLAEFQKESALEALRESEERFRSLYENSTVGLYRTAPDGKIHLANPVLVRMLGYLSFSDLSNRNLKKNGFGPTYPRRQFVETIEKDGEVRGLESAWTRKDGTIFYCRESARAIRDGQGKTLYYDGIVEDITERKQAEEALKESEIKYRELVENSPDAIAIYVAEKIVYANNECLHLLAAASSAELIGKSIIQFVHPDYRASVIERMKKFANERIVSPLTEEKFVRLDGSNVEVEVMAMPIKFENKLAVQLIIRNISERKQAEEEKRVLEERLQWAEKMEAIGTLAGGIAHDFNNLLMGIQGFASMILTNLDPAHSNYERLKRIESQVQSGANLTSQLLGFARGGRYEVKPTDMNDIIEKTSSMFGRTKKEISIHRKYGKDLWSVEVDRGQMEQVFVNLYVNAWQAMAGGGEICLETENVLLNGEQALLHSLLTGKYVKITVTDTGSGMDEKTRLRIFDPFFTTKEMGRGIGLGLASVYGIIKGHRGMINVYSEPGHGTTFTIYLPASEKEVVKEEPATAKIASGTETILLVEDEKIVMEVNRELLESMGYKVYAVGSGQEGIAVYLEKRNKIDLVILDMVMPGVSGGEVFDRLREINPAVKVLLSSGYSLNGEAQHIMDRGCNGFLQKPFQIEKLSWKVREMLGI